MNDLIKLTHRLHALGLSLYVGSDKDYQIIALDSEQKYFTFMNLPDVVSFVSGVEFGVDLAKKKACSTYLR